MTIPLMVHSIATQTGLSRFDGVSFRSFDTDDGLPHESVWSILEASDGTLYLGTRDGLVRMLPERSVEGLAFTPVPGAPERIAALAEDAAGRIWTTSRGKHLQMRSGSCRGVYRNTHGDPVAP